MSKTLSLILNRDIKEAGLQQSVISNWLKEQTVKSGLIDRIELVWYETVINIIYHENGSIDPVETLINLNQDQIKFTIFSNGEPYDISSVKLPDIKEHALTGKNHGLGLYIINKLSDHINYSRIHGKNKIILIFKIIGGCCED